MYSKCLCYSSVLKDKQICSLAWKQEYKKKPQLILYAHALWVIKVKIRKLHFGGGKLVASHLSLTTAFICTDMPPLPQFPTCTGAFHFLTSRNQDSISMANSRITVSCVSFFSPHKSGPLIFALMLCLPLTTSFCSFGKGSLFTVLSGDVPTCTW